MRLRVNSTPNLESMLREQVNERVLRTPFSFNLAIQGSTAFPKRMVPTANHLRSLTRDVWPGAATAVQADERQGLAIQAKGQSWMARGLRVRWRVAEHAGLSAFRMFA